MLFETGGLNDFSTNLTIDVFVGDNHFIVDEANVSVHVGEVCKHLAAMWTLKLGSLLIMNHADVFFQAERAAKNLKVTYYRNVKYP